ncbi:hypothetical protein [Paraliobacillus sediminis]|uniref:hypothetical protein n=1 Tax=Paraliobacillus sediminis TaxID=1885916 RepID=UPI000E3BDB47|nr:hypothetical protein [Paraliobacillus sediminis]
MFYLLLFLIGFGLAVAGGVTIILYINLIPAGLTWIDYFMFIQTRAECYLFLLGIIMITLAIPKLPRLFH